MDIGWLKKLEIIGYKDGTFNTLSGHRFRLMINPKDYESKKEISIALKTGLEDLFSKAIIKKDWNLNLCLILQEY